MKLTQTGSALRSSLLTMAGIAALLLIIATQLPKGFSDDLGRIGRGTSTAVLIHNKNSVQGLNLMELVNKVRPEFTPQVEFLIADIDSSSGKAFMAAQDLRNVGLVLLSPDGTRLAVVTDSPDEDALRKALGAAFAKRH
jgi:hypothetical protein